VSNDTVGKTLLVAFSVCLVCAVVVSTAAVALKPLQDANIERDRQQNILAAAGLLDESMTVEEQFSSVQVRAVDLFTGQFTDDIDPTSYDHLKAAKSSDLSSSFAELNTSDIAKIGRRENYAVVYLVEDARGQLDKVILPIEEDLNTVAGIGFFSDGETPGLGGEINNPDWKAQWINKEAFNNGALVLEVIKGAAAPDAASTIDGLSGATLTTKGVDNLIKFWLGENGFRPFLDNLKAAGV
jgi:Na+-transporting NADH:ubiquinone oxidoreductase subunit C